jgi:serine protease DegQ
MRRLWLIFAQTTTVCLAVFFVLHTLWPDLFSANRPDSTSIVTIKEAATTTETKKIVSFSDAAKKAMPSVVNIFTSKKIKTPRHPLSNDPLFRYFFGEGSETDQHASSLGSGVIVSSEGYILTNYHVVESADEIEVALADGRKVSAKTIGADPETDIAVLKIKLENVPAITFGNTDQVKVGDIVLAIGNPFGVGQTVTMGIISALGRNRLGINTFENFIQTDAAINPGNSGGALVDVQGNLIGLNSAIYSRSGGSLGIGFAIPVSTVKQMMEQIIKNGGVTRGWIGVEVQDITPEIADSFKLMNAKGVLISGVLRNGPADQAGIKPGDILMAINEKEITDSAKMLDMVSSLTPGQTAHLRILRSQKKIELEANVGKRPKLQKSSE